MATILCVDDEPAIGAVMEHTLAAQGHTPIIAAGVERALETLDHAAVDLIITDYIMPGLNGLDLIDQLQRNGSQIPVILMTGFCSIENAVTAIKRGAVDYLVKPVTGETLEVAVTQALESVRLRRESEAFRSEIRKLKSCKVLIGESVAFRRTMDLIGMIAPTRATVLLQGESGTGKELFARAIHEQSPRADEAMVTVNCAAMPDGLVESALFGHEKGAFTGATVRTTGAFERANGGTLLLDEISEMRLDLQAKLLRVIQEQEFDRVGGSQTIKVDVRLIATTNRNLRGEVEAGRFRSDLFYRLNVVPVRTAPLRERIEDIPRLAYHFAHRAAEQYGGTAAVIAPDAMELLMTYAWPGNVRELANAVERAVIISRCRTLLPEHFSDHLPLTSGSGAAGGFPSRDHARSSTPGGVPAVRSSGGVAIGSWQDSTPRGPMTAVDAFNLDGIERQTIDRALAATGGNRTRAAKLLGISERTLRNKLNGVKIAV
jgi:two-component system NtrC family response regulator